MTDLPRMVVLAGLLVLVVLAGKYPVVRQWFTLSDVSVVLALVSVAVGTFSAIMCGVIGQLTDDARGLWICAGVILYSMVGIPAATLTATTSFGDAAIGNVRLMAHVLLVVSTLIAVFASVRPPWDGLGVLLFGVLTTAVVAGLGLEFPVASAAVNTNQTVRYSVCAAWVLSGVGLVLASWVRREAWLSWVGMGCTIIALAHTLRVVVGSPNAPLGVSFSTVRFFGVVVLLIGTAATTRRGLLEVHTTYFEYQERLRLAKIGLEEVEQRAHDVRNGLAGLAGVMVLLEAGARDESQLTVLREAVAAELARLDALLRPASAAGGAAMSVGYDVEPVLCQQAALRAATGLDVRVDVEPGLRAVGSASVLSQVMTNLLANCAQHAPGSPVQIQARRAGDLVEIRVRDFGAGLSPGAESKIFEMGVRGRSSTGQGLGLHICRKLLAAESGTIEMRSVSQRDVQRAPGCMALIALPSTTVSTVVPAVCV